MHQADDRHQRRAAGEHEGLLRLARRIDRVEDALQSRPKGLGPGHVRVVADGFVGGAVEKVELEIGEAVLAQAPKEIVEEPLRLWVRRVEDVVRAAKPRIGQGRPARRLEQPFRMGLRQLRIGRDVKRREPDADLQPVPVHASGEGVQASGKELVRHPVAPALPARHPAIVELDHRAVSVGRGLDEFRHPLREERRMPRDVAFRHRQAEVIPAAPPTWHRGEAARAGGVTGGGQRLAQRRGPILAV